MINKLISLRGIPGSGKSTYANKLAIPGMAICSADSYSREWLPPWWNHEVIKCEKE